MKTKGGLNPYGNLIHLPRHVSGKRPQMSLTDRAAQFAPFAAVVGHESSVKEAARLTDVKRDLDETQKAIIDDQLREIASQVEDSLTVRVIHFQADALKDGGKYIETLGKVMKIDMYTSEVCMVDGTRIKIDAIFDIENNVK